MHVQTDADSLSLVLPSEFEVLEQVVNETEAFLLPRVGDADLAYRVTLLASEAVTNAIEHGNELDASKKVRMWLRVTPTRIELTVEDEGRGFDPARIENPLEADNLLHASGRGVYLMGEMADEVAYEDQGRRVRMVFHRSA